MHVHGSPNVTAAFTSPAAAPSCAAALCTSMAPCEYPAMTTAESGHCWSAVWTSWTLCGCPTHVVSMITVLLPPG